MDSINLFGADSIWGASLVLEGPGRERICGTITPSSPDAKMRIAEARFMTPVAGSVFFFSLRTAGKIETKIFSNMYHVVSGKSSDHGWQIYITDIIGSNKKRQTCNFLQVNIL